MGQTAADKSSSALFRARLNARHRWFIAAAVVSILAATVAEMQLLAAVLPTVSGAKQLRNAIPLDQEFATINRVAEWPADWVAAVCESPLYPLRHYTRLPEATSTASCRSRIKPIGTVDYLMVARFPNEFLMQVDLSNEGYTWYAFAYDHGGLIVFASAADDATVTSTKTHLVISPVLEPLEQFSFNVYRGPGPP